MIFKSPEENDTREVWKFYWFPKRFNNGYLVWLEKVYVRQMWWSGGILSHWFSFLLLDPNTGHAKRLSDNNTHVWSEGQVEITHTTITDREFKKATNQPQDESKR